VSTLYGREGGANGCAVWCARVIQHGTRRKQPGPDLPRPARASGAPGCSRPGGAGGDRMQVVIEQSERVQAQLRPARRPRAQRAAAHRRGGAAGGPARGRSSHAHARRECEGSSGASGSKGKRLQWQAHLAEELKRLPRRDPLAPRRPGSPSRRVGP